MRTGALTNRTLAVTARLAAVQLALVGLVVAAGSEQPAAATTLSWDAVSDFKADSSANPNGVWSYRTTPGTTGYGTLLHRYSRAISGGPIEGWYNVQPDFHLPADAVNYSSSTWCSGTLCIPTDVVDLHPYRGHNAVLRWTAPGHMRACLRVSARDLDPGAGDGVRVYLRKGNNDPLLWSVTIPNGGGVQSFTITRANRLDLNRGADINITVDAGAANDIYYDSTGITETIYSC